jgi:hypothetical protein
MEKPSRLPGRIPEVGRFYILGKGIYHFHADSFLGNMAGIPFFLLKVRESELAKNASAYFIDFIVGEQVCENVLITCDAELNLDLVEEDEEK